MYGILAELELPVTLLELQVSATQMLRGLETSADRLQLQKMLSTEQTAVRGHEPNVLATPDGVAERSAMHIGKIIYAGRIVP